MIKSCNLEDVGNWKLNIKVYSKYDLEYVWGFKTESQSDLNDIELSLVNTQCNAALFHLQPSSL